jgi:hypothetical protein
VSLVLAHALARVAQAQGVGSSAAEDPWNNHHRVGAELSLGVGTPLGFGGAALDLTPIPYLTLSGGFGFARNITCDGSNGPQIAFMPRARAPIGPIAIAFGAGLSLGSYAYQPSCPFEQDAVRQWDTAYWYNMEGSLEYRMPSGVQFRVFLGKSLLLNGGDYRCESAISPTPDCSGGGGQEIGYGGIGVRLPLTDW